MCDIDYMIGNRRDEGPVGFERRRAPRVRTQLTALVVPSFGAPRCGRIDNVSASGMWVDTPDPPPVGTPCTVAVELSDGDLPIRAMAGKVARRDARGFALACHVDQRAPMVALYEHVVADKAAAEVLAA